MTIPTFGVPPSGGNKGESEKGMSRDGLLEDRAPRVGSLGPCGRLRLRVVQALVAVGR